MNVAERVLARWPTLGRSTFILETAVGHRAHRGKHRAHREMPQKIAEMRTHPTGEFKFWDHHWIILLDGVRLKGKKFGNDCCGAGQKHITDALHVFGSIRIKSSENKRGLTEKAPTATLTIEANHRGGLKLRRRMFYTDGRKEM